MAFESQGGNTGLTISPGGFEFGIQGWMWPEPNPKSITFFLDGSAMVCDQHGRPIKGVVAADGSALYFATTPPSATTDSSLPYEKRFHVDRVEGGKKVRKHPLATHEQVIVALESERIDWLTLNRAGTPQLLYDKLKEVPNLPMTSEEELRRIPDPQLRKDVLRVYSERKSKIMAEVEEHVE